MDTAIPPREETGSQISTRLLEVVAHAEFELLAMGESRNHAPRVS